MISRRIRASALFFAALSLVCNSQAYADPPSARSAQQWLDTAHQDLESLRYEDARQNVKWALQTGAADVALIKEVYRLMAETSASLGDEPAAESAFANLLSLEPSFRLPNGTSPKIERPFERARNWMSARLPLRVTMRQSAETVTVFVESDPTHVVAAVRLAFVTYDGTQGAMLSQRSEGNRFTILLPLGAQPNAHASAVDRYGNIVVPRIVAVAEPIAPPKVEAPVSKPQGALHSPLVYVGGAVVSAAIAIGFGLKWASQRDDLSKCDKNLSLCYPEGYEQTEQSADRNQTVAMVALGTTVVFSAVAIWLGVRSGSGDKASPGANLTFTPGGLAGRF